LPVVVNEFDALVDFKNYGFVVVVGGGHLVGWLKAFQIVTGLAGIEPALVGV